MKEKPLDLNRHLFASLEELSDEALKGEELQASLLRARTKTGVAREIISNWRLVLDAEKAIAENEVRASVPMIGHEKDG